MKLNLSLNKIEACLFTFCISVVGLGFYAAHVDPEFFSAVYTVEDGLVETITVLALLAGSITCFRRVIKLRDHKAKWFLICTAILGTLFFFGAGEELSWGQRIFKTYSPEFFQNFNSQGETNLHNLEFDFGGEKKFKVNKVIFGLFLGIFVGIYMLILPVLYAKVEKIKNFINSWAIPIPRPIHILVYLVLASLANTTPSGKKGELLEFSGVFIFLLVTLYPRNLDIFNKSTNER